MKQTTKSSVFSTGLKKKMKNDTQKLEHTSYNEGVVPQVKGMRSDPSWFASFDSTHHLDHHYKNHNLVNTWTKRLCLCFNNGVN